MKITVSIEDALYQQALEMADAGLDDPEKLIHEALRVYVRIQAGKRLTALGGTVSDMKDIPRRRDR